MLLRLDFSLVLRLEFGLLLRLEAGLLPRFDPGLPGCNSGQSLPLLDPQLVQNLLRLLSLAVELSLVRSKGGLVVGDHVELSLRLLLFDAEPTLLLVQQAQQAVLLVLDDSLRSHPRHKLIRIVGDEERGARRQSGRTLVVGQR